jgi:uncharacterized protein
MLERLSELAVIFISIVLQSLPFILVGVFAAAFVQRFLSEELVARHMPREPVLAVLVGGLFGMLAPVCDCGAIPLGRRLAAKGIPAYAAVAFMLAAPVVNPIVAISTLVAFQGNWTVVGLRLTMALSVALVVGLALSMVPPNTSGLSRQPRPIRGGAGMTFERHPATSSRRSGIAEILALVRSANSEFFDVIFFVVLGALFTAAAQTLVPRGDLLSLGTSPIGSIAALMPVASLLSICSEADAFVARAFANTFSPGAVIAFMVIGQLVDLRNGFLLLRTVGSAVTILIVIISYGLVFVEALAINWARISL